MTREVVSVPLSAPCKEVARHMRNRQVSALPVIDAEGTVVGVVSEADLMLKQEGLDLELRPLFERRRRRRERAKAAAKTAGELMTSPAVTIRARVPVAEAARTMHETGVKRLPVTDQVGHLVGIVSRADLLKLFLRTDDEIGADVEDALALSLRIRPSAILVAVRDGVVRLSGRVKHRSEIAASVAEVRRVDGVVAVETELEYEIDDETSQWPTPTPLLGP